MLNTVDLTFEFEYGDINGRKMQIEIISGTRKILTNYQTKVIVENVEIPGSIRLEFTGKIPGKDTRVDDQGKIIQDMYVKLVGMKIDNLKIPEWALQKNLTYETSNGQQINTCYIGFNGTLTIGIPETTVFSFYRRLALDKRS